MGRAGESVREAWREEVEECGLQKARILRVVRKAVGIRTILLICACAWFSAFLELVGLALALDTILALLEESAALQQAGLDGGQSRLGPALASLGLLFALPVLHRCAGVALSLADGHHSSQLSAAFGRLAYEKAARLPVGCGYHTPQRAAPGQEGAGAVTAGQRPSMVQLLSADIAQEWICMFKTLAIFTAAPFIFITLLLLLAWHLQLAGLLGTLYLIPGLAFSWLLLHRSLHHRRQYQAYQDVRIHRFAEFLGNVRAVKASTWERFIEGRVQQARKVELNSSHSCAVWMGLLAANAHSMTWLMALGGLFFHAMTEGSVEARHTWVVFQIVASLQACLNLMVAGLRKAVTLPSSLQRVEAFLKLPERPTDVLGAPEAEGPCAKLLGSFGFEEGSPPVLHDLNLEFKHGELVAVVGAGASGKSALLQALLGELFPAGLALAMAPRRAAYSAQEPWILEASLQENVTLGQRHEPERYHSALHAASLLADLALLPGGDQAPLGPHGASLSKSQRVRVALARASYMSQENLVLLDDPFGQLPELMSRQIFQRLLLGQALRESTRVVVMGPKSRLLGHFDRVVLLDEGRIVEEGSPGKVLRSEAFLALLGESEAPWQDAWPQPALNVAAVSSPSASGRPSCWNCVAPPAVSVPRELARQAPQPEPEGHERLSLSTVGSWLRAGGPLSLALAIAFSLLQRCAQLLECLLLAMWGDSAMRGQCDHRKFMGAILAMILVNSVLIWASEWASSRFSSCAAGELHGRILSSLLQAPADRFFDRHPHGRLLSRLSTDVAQIDGALAGFALGALRAAAGTLLQQAYMLCVVPPWAALCALPVCACVLLLGFLYRGAAISLACLARSSLASLQELSAQSPNTHVSIRANGAYPMLLEKYSGALDNATRANYLFMAACKSWISLRTTLCLSLALSAFTLYVLLTPNSGVGVGTLGLVVSLSLALLTDLEALAELFARCALALGALQRVADLFSTPREASPEAMKGSAGGSADALRLVLRLSHGNLVTLAMQTGHSPSDLVIVDGHGAPLLQAAQGGRALTCAEGRRLQDLAPGVAGLQGLASGYHIVAVGAACRDARAMAEALMEPPRAGGDLRLDLWSAACAEGGLGMQCQGLCAGYSGLADVLRGASFEVPGRSRTALVGPPGSGKTTVLWCLLRLVEPRRGKVLLGGLDAAAVSLAALRGMVGLVPAEAAVFEGSWRLNLDPLGEHTDVRLRQVMQRIGLESQTKSLDEPIASRAGCKLCLLEKLLLGLARMVLRQPPLLLLDSCPTPADCGAHKAVSSVLAAEFPDVTVLAAVQDAETVVGFDRVVLLRKGEVVEQISTQRRGGLVSLQQ